MSLFIKNTNKQFNFLFLFLHFQINSRAKMYSDTASTQSYWLIIWQGFKLVVFGIKATASGLRR